MQRNITFVNTIVINKRISKSEKAREFKFLVSIIASVGIVI